MTDKKADAQAIIDQTIAGVGPVEIDPELRYAVVTPDQGVEIIEALPDSKRLNPRRPTGTTKVLNVDALEALWAKHAAPGVSELYADPEGLNITAVLNANAGRNADAGHGDHRVVLQLVKSRDWNDWLARDGKLFAQVDFAEFLEDHLSNMLNPSGAEMLELAQHFQASTKVEFKSSDVVANGRRALRYEENTTAKAGEKGDIEIPTTFELQLVPFEGSKDAFKVTARFRYRISNGQLAIGFKLDRPHDVLLRAFDDVREAADQACDTPSLLGAPAAR